MPPANRINLADQLLRTLIWGEAKTKKTTWACMAARAGYNVLLLDGDDGSQVVRQLPDDVQAKVLVVDVRDTLDNAVFKQFCETFVRSTSKFNWNERTKKADLIPNKDDSYIVFQPRLFNSSDVVIFDSWKSFCSSTLFEYATKNEFDMADAEKEEWDGFGFQGRFQDFIIKSLHCLPCHVVVIGHSTIYEKWDRRDKRNPKLIYRKTQIVSSSGPHAGTMFSHFTDILYVERIGSDNFTIDSSGTTERVGGSRLVEPRVYPAANLPITTLLERIGSKASGEASLGARWYATGAEIPSIGKPGVVAAVSPPVIQNTGGVLSKLQMKG